MLGKCDQYGMSTLNSPKFFDPESWLTKGGGPRYRQLYQHIRDAIRSGVLEPDTLLPPEREMAAQADVSRVTIRKTVAALVEDGLVRQRQGSGTYVRADREPRLQQSLSSLVSFTETMAMRGYTSSSEVLEALTVAPTPTETVALGISGSGRVSRIKRLRIADPGPLAIEVSSVPEDVLPDATVVDISLYHVLRQNGFNLVRAIQRVTAENLSEQDAELLRLPHGTAALRIDRTGYLANGRPVEFTTGLYRSDVYDFITEVRLEGDP